MAKRQFLAPSTDFYLRVYVRNDDVQGTLEDRIIQPGPTAAEYLDCTYLNRACYATKWRPRVTLGGNQGPNLTMPHWDLGEAPGVLDYGRWYRFEYHVHFRTATRIQVHVRISDDAETLLYTDEDFHPDPTTGQWAGATLATYYANTNPGGGVVDFGITPAHLVNLELGNIGAASATNTGLHWYFAGVELRSDTWPGGVISPPARCLASTYVRPATPRTGATLYCSASASGGGNGTELNPYTLAELRANVVAGNLVYLKGDFGANSYLRHGAGGSPTGTATQWIVYRRWPGEAQQPIIRCNEALFRSLTVESGFGYIAFEDLSVIPPPAPAFTYSFDWHNAHHVHLINCTLTEETGHVGTADGGASDCWIEGCTFDTVGDVLLNEGDALVVQNGSHRNTIVRNVINKCGHVGLTIGQFQTAGEATCDDNIVAQNQVHNIWAGGINVGGKGVRTLVECNDVWGSASAGLGDPGTQSGLFCDGTNGTYRYNRVWDCRRDGIDMGAYVFAGYTQTATGNQVYHNTLFRNGGAAVHMFVINNLDASAVLANNVFENNVGWANHTAGATDVGRFYDSQYNMISIDLNAATPWGPTSLGGNIIRYNAFSRTTSADRWAHIIRSTTNLSYTLTQFQSAFATCVANQTAVNPLFVSEGATPDLHLQASSPVIDDGRGIPGVAYLGSAPDLGAFEQA